MPRIRSIKPTFWGSPRAAAMSRDARLVALGLMSASDDDGRFLASPAAVIGAVFPNDEKVTIAEVKKWVSEVAATGLIVLYEARGVRYGVFPSWHKHQVISRYTPSSLPVPEGVECVPRRTSSTP